MTQSIQGLALSARLVTRPNLDVLKSILFK